MEVAAALVAKAKSVTVVGMEKVPFERVLGAEVGAVLQKVHARNHITARTTAHMTHTAHAHR
jgi:NAD(P)H-nitrite reductase large subunit